MTMSCDDAGSSGVRRFEVFTGAGKRRDWPPEVKASIVAESYSGKHSVSAVARRHGMSASQLFTWRRLLRKEMEGRGIALPAPSRETPMFVPAVLEEQEPSPPVVASKRASRRRSARAGAIEVEVAGALVRIGSGADADMITAVITALRASR